MRTKRHAAINTRQSRSMQRAALQAEKDQAIQDGNLERAKELIEELKAIAPKSNGRSSSSVFRDPYDPELLEIYAHKLVHEILSEYGKEIRLDFGFLGVVVGLANIVVSSAAAVGEPMSEALCRELVRRVFVKMHERNHGMGMLYCERANQVLRKLYVHPTVIKTLGLPTNERPWVKRKPLGDVDADFGRRWMEYLAGQVDSEGQGPEEGETTGEEKTTEQPNTDAEQVPTARDTDTDTEAQPEPSARQSAEQPSGVPSHAAAAEPTGAPSHPETAIAADERRDARENTADAETDLGKTEAETVNLAEAQPETVNLAEAQPETVNTDSDAEMPDNTDESDTDSAPAARPALNLNDLLE